jgi:hypothetical protein
VKNDKDAETERERGQVHLQRCLKKMTEAPSIRGCEVGQTTKQMGSHPHRDLRRLFSSTTARTPKQAKHHYLGIPRIFRRNAKKFAPVNRPALLGGRQTHPPVTLLLSTGISKADSSSSTNFYNPLAAFSLLILELSRSHTVTQHSQ